MRGTRWNEGSRNKILDQYEMRNSRGRETLYQLHASFIFPAPRAGETVEYRLDLLEESLMRRRWRSILCPYKSESGGGFFV